MATPSSSATWRYLRDDRVGAAEGLALDEALLRGVGREAPSPAPTLRLYTYANAALVGRYQTLDAELHVEACVATGTEVGRRPTGGGAIVMGPGQLGVALAIPAPVSAPKQTLVDLARGIVDGLGYLGVGAEFGGKNDLLVDGRKIAGLGLYLDPHGGLLFHASVLGDLEVDHMLRVLNIPAAKLGGRAAAAVEDRVTTVQRVLGRAPDMDVLREAVAAGFGQRHGVRLIPAEATADERTEAARLVEEKYANPAWLSETAAAPDGTGSASFRSPEGHVRLYLAVQGNLIKSVLFTGDFSTLPAGLRQLEAALRWRRLERAVVLGVVRTVEGRVGDDRGWAKNMDVLDALLDAGERAIERERAAPYRPHGSCYFPDDRSGRGAPIADSSRAPQRSHQ